MPLVHRVLATMLFLAVAQASAHATPEGPSKAVRAVLARQQAAWNRGDIDAFMQGYWHSDALRFASGAEIRSGWTDALNSYRRRYPDSAAMGQLGFDLIEVRPLSAQVVYVFGRWRLTLPAQSEAQAPHGLFTLIFEKKGGSWLITRDHTSSASP